MRENVYMRKCQLGLDAGTFSSAEIFTFTVCTILLHHHGAQPQSLLIDEYMIATRGPR